LNTLNKKCEKSETSLYITTLYLRLGRINCTIGKKMRGLIQQATRYQRWKVDFANAYLHRLAKPPLVNKELELVQQYFMQTGLEKKGQEEW
jgi:hypothetical protein